MQKHQNLYLKMNGGDPAFKLFGRKIPVPEPQIHAGDTSSEVTYPDTETSQTNTSGEPDKFITSENGKEEHQTSTNPKDEQPETNRTDQDIVFKKPDKIVPCPRCNSLETKFCYFNNYNVNQPRHFCKNCQRYWTAGGTMRNVPIGAGRRKNKQLASQFRQIMVSSEGVPMTRMETTPDSANQQLLSPRESTAAFRPSMGNGTVLKFGAEAPLCESMETVLSLGDQKRCVDTGTLSHGEVREEPSSLSSNELPGHVMQKERIGFPGPTEPNTQNPPQCYPVPPWIFPWNQGPTNVTPVAAAVQCSSERISAPNNSTSVAVPQWCPTPMMAVPGFCPTNIPLQFVPAYWGCMPLSISGSNGCLSPSSSTSNSSCSGNVSPTIGKHSREANFVEDEQPKKCILVPKTLRIDDPNESSRSPIWDTLGIKPVPKQPLRGKSFSSFESKAEGKEHITNGNHISEATNPAALSRS